MTNRSRNHLSSKYVVFAIEMYRCGAMRFTLMTIMFDLSLILQLFLQHAVITIRCDIYVCSPFNLSSCQFETKYNFKCN